MVTLKGTGITVLAKRLTVKIPDFTGAPGDIDPSGWLVERYGLKHGHVYRVIALHNETFTDHSNTVMAYLAADFGKIIKVGLEHLVVVEVE